MLGKNDAPSGREVLNELSVRVFQRDGDVVVVDDRDVGDALQSQQARVAFSFRRRLGSIKCPLYVLKRQVLPIVKLHTVSDRERDTFGIVADAPLRRQIRDDCRPVGRIKPDEVAVVSLQALWSEPYGFGVVVPSTQSYRNSTDQRTTAFSVGRRSHRGCWFWCGGWSRRLGCRRLHRYWRCCWIFAAATYDDRECDAA